MYATPGVHAYALPWGILHDITDRGPLWDPALNSHIYKYDLKTRRVTPSNFTPNSPVNWFYFNGRWGDKIYPLSDKRQYGVAGQFHYVSGPSGPKFKSLARETVCQSKGNCPIRNYLPPNFEFIDREDDWSTWEQEKAILAQLIAENKAAERRKDL
jgi:hypothetical protein